MILVYNVLYSTLSQTASLQIVKTTPNKSLGYDTKLSDGEDPSRSFGECGMLCHCHCFQAHSSPDWLYLLESHLWVK